MKSPITNEEKAMQIAECCSVMPPTSITQSDVIAMTNNATMQAMEWKDEQLPKWKPYLYATTSLLPELIVNANADSDGGDDEIYLYYQGYAINVNELIKKLPR